VVLVVTFGAVFHITSEGDAEANNGKSIGKFRIKYSNMIFSEDLCH